MNQGHLALTTPLLLCCHRICSGQHTHRLANAAARARYDCHLVQQQAAWLKQAAALLVPASAAAATFCGTAASGGGGGGSGFQPGPCGCLLRLTAVPAAGVAVRSAFQVGGKHRQALAWRHPGGYLINMLINQQRE